MSLFVLVIPVFLILVAYVPLSPGPSSSSQSTLRSLLHLAQIISHLHNRGHDVSLHVVQRHIRMYTYELIKRNRAKVL